MFTAIMGIGTALLPWLLKAFELSKSVAGAGTAAVVAIIQIIPPVLEVVFKLYQEVTTKPVAALMFGVAVAGPIGFYYGVAQDKTIREAFKADVVKQANRRADIAIEKWRQKYEDALKECKRARNC